MYRPRLFPYWKYALGSCWSSLSTVKSVFCPTGACMGNHVCSLHLPFEFHIMLVKRGRCTQICSRKKKKKTVSMHLQKQSDQLQIADRCVVRNPTSSLFYTALRLCSKHSTRRQFTLRWSRKSFCRENSSKDEPHTSSSDGDFQQPGSIKVVYRLLLGPLYARTTIGKIGYLGTFYTCISIHTVFS